MGKRIDGVLNREFEARGSFKSCLDLRGEVYHQTHHSEFGGKYCLANVFTNRLHPNETDLRHMTPNGEARVRCFSLRYKVKYCAYISRLLVYFDKAIVSRTLVRTPTWLIGCKTRWGRTTEDIPLTFSDVNPIEMKKTSRRGFGS